MPLKAIDGLPVMDAKKSITVHINANDIAKADRKEPMDCAVARCLRREFHAQEARIHLGRVYVRTNKGNWTRYMTPKPLRAEIIAFDRGGAVRAGSVHLIGAIANQENRQAAGKQERPEMAHQCFQAPAPCRRQCAQRASVTP